MVHDLSFFLSYSVIFGYVSIVFLAKYIWSMFSCI